MDPLVSGAMGIFGLAGLDWGGTPPTIIDMTALFKKFETELMSEVEQTTAKSIVDTMSSKYEGLTRTLKNLDGCTDEDLLKDYLAAVDTSMNELQGEFKMNTYVKKYSYYFIYQLYLNAHLHLNVKNLVAASASNKKERMRQLSLAKSLYLEYKDLLTSYIDTAVTFRLDNIEDVQCDCNPCANADRAHLYHWRDKIASTE